MRDTHKYCLSKFDSHILFCANVLVAIYFVHEKARRSQSFRCGILEKLEPLPGHHRVKVRVFLKEKLSETCSSQSKVTFLLIPANRRPGTTREAVRTERVKLLLDRYNLERG